MRINTQYNNPALSTPSDVTRSQIPTSVSDRRYGRVKRITLDDNDPDYELFGRMDSLYGIRVYPLGSQLDEDEVDELPFARNFDLSIKTVPVLNEVVEIFSGPSELDPPNTQIGSNLYYSRIVNTSNNLNHNALPDATTVVEEIDLGEDVTEQENKALLFPFPGDTIIQGRTGGSIRVSGYSHPKNQFSNEENNAKPFIIISSEDIQESEDIPQPRVESLNNLGSTLFLGTDHNIFLNSTYKFKETYKESPVIKDKYKPVDFNLYRGSQIGANSGRIVLQGNEDGVFLIGKESVGLSGNSVNIEGKEYLGFDAPKIYLGRKAKTRESRAQQPAVKGREFVNWEKDLLRELRLVALKLSTITNPAQAVAILSQTGNSLLTRLDRLEKNLERTQSKKVFIE